MTKAEFLDVLAGDSRIGNKKEAGQAVDAVLDAITNVLQGGGEVARVVMGEGGLEACILGWRGGGLLAG